MKSIITIMFIKRHFMSISTIMTMNTIYTIIRPLSMPGHILTGTSIAVMNTNIITCQISTIDMFILQKYRLLCDKRCFQAKSRLTSHEPDSPSALVGGAIFVHFGYNQTVSDCIPGKQVM